MWTVSIQIGMQQPYEIGLNKGITTFGRNEGADIWLASHLLSRSAAHGRFIVNSDRLLYEDLGGLNGTTVNGVKLPFKQNDGKIVRTLELQSGSIMSF